MHGLGNDFVILDGRNEAVTMTPELARALADRQFGIGCDQLILLEPSTVADVKMRIWNYDGGEVESCGNASRCVVALTGAKTLAEGPHRASRPLRIGDGSRMDTSGDRDFMPDVALADDEVAEGAGWALRAVLTPGHAANHTAFALEGTGILFSGDHVMGWSTTVVAPPDGSMADYMRSLDRLLNRRDRIFLPGHGGPVTAPVLLAAHIGDRRLHEEIILPADRGRLRDFAVISLLNMLRKALTS